MGLKNEAELKKRGVEEVMVYCVNDGAVMKAWGEKQGIGGSFLKFFGDPYSDLTRSLGMVLDHPGPRGLGLINRCKRFVILFSKGEVKFKAIAESAMTRQATAIQTRP